MDDGQSCRRSDWTQSKVDAEDISNSMKKLNLKFVVIINFTANSAFNILTLRLGKGDSQYTW